jgi:DMSO/TMAO reductase YedYZ molybdopterin-dependent catalytic subunit
MSIWDPIQRVQRLRRADEHRERDMGVGRLPPGQVLTQKFPVLTYGGTPRIDLNRWRFQVWGLVDEDKEWTWEEFLALPHKTQTCDIHCVTRWSKLDTTWEGLPFTEVYSLLKLKPEAKFVMIHSYGGYTTNMTLEEMLDDDVMFAFNYEGQPLEPEHGGPMRLLVPKLYFWKSAKWVRGLEFLPENRTGFWEMYGYHMHGDPWLSERFSS